MATNIKVLNTVSIASTTSSTPTAIYSPTGTKSALVTSISLYFPTGGGGGPVDVLIGSRNAANTTSPVVFHKQAALAVGTSAVMADVVSLRASDSENLAAYLSATGPVNCVVFGIERD